MVVPQCGRVLCITELPDDAPWAAHNRRNETIKLIDKAQENMEMLEEAARGREERRQRGMSVAGVSGQTYLTKRALRCKFWVMNRGRCMQVTRAVCTQNIVGAAT